MASLLIGKEGKVGMSYSFEGFAPQGWQCPVCKRVYSPTTPIWWYCDNGETVTSTNVTTIKDQSGMDILEWGKSKTITNTDSKTE